MVQKEQHLHVLLRVVLGRILRVVQVRVLVVQISRLIRHIQVQLGIRHRHVHGHVMRDMLVRLRTVIHHVQTVVLVIIAQEEHTRRRVRLGHMVHQRI